MTTSEIEGACGLTRDTTSISNEPQQVLHGVGRRYANKTITLDYVLRYARILIARVNKEGKIQRDRRDIREQD